MSGVDPLIRRAQAGDEPAFRELFQRHRGDVAKLVFRLLGPGGAHEVEDVVQDVFIHVFRSLKSFKGDAKLSTWIYRLATNVVRMHLRRQRSRPRFVDAPSAVATLDSQPGGETPHEAAMRRRRMLALYSLLDRLSEKKRTVLILHDLQSVAAADIAEVVDAPIRTVRTRLFYARRELFAMLAEEPSLQEVFDDPEGWLTPRNEAAAAPLNERGSRP